VPEERGELLGLPRPGVGKDVGDLPRLDVTPDLRSGANGSGAVVPEILRLIVLPACPLLGVGCHLAQEGSRARPAVGDVVGPGLVLRGKLAFLGAAV